MFLMINKDLLIKRRFLEKASRTLCRAPKSGVRNNRVVSQFGKYLGFNHEPHSLRSGVLVTNRHTLALAGKARKSRETAIHKKSEKNRIDYQINNFPVSA